MRPANNTLEWMAGERVSPKSNVHGPATTQLARSTKHDMKPILLIIVSLVASGVALAQNDVPSGKLGFPLGTYLTVEGQAAKPGFKVNPTCTLAVDTVNGKRLGQPVTIVVEDLNINNPLPQRGRVVIKGYESGKMIGAPPGAVEAAKEAGKDLAVPQAGWQLYRFFVLTSWVQPKSTGSHEHNVEPGGAANRSQPVTSQTNRTSSAAGSGG